MCEKGREERRVTLEMRELRHYLICAQRNEIDKPSLDYFAHKIAADVDVARKFAAH